MSQYPIKFVVWTSPDDDLNNHELIAEFTEFRKCRFYMKIRKPNCPEFVTNKTDTISCGIEDARNIAKGKDWAESGKRPGANFKVRRKLRVTGTEGICWFVHHDATTAPPADSFQAGAPVYIQDRMSTCAVPADS